MEKAKTFFLLFLWGLISFFSGCSLDYSDARIAEDITEETPDTILINFTHTIVTNGKVSVILKAERAETFGKRKQVVLKNAHFLEFDEEGSVLTEGSADEAIFYTDSEDAHISGSIFIYSPEEETGIYAESFSWTKDGKKLQANPEDQVTLKKDDGSYVEGKGFKADFRKKKLEFSSEVRGRYVWEEEEED